MTLNTATLDQSEKRGKVDPPHGNYEEFSPTLLTLAIATHPPRRPKQRQEPNLSATTNE